LNCDAIVGVGNGQRQDEGRHSVARRGRREKMKKKTEKLY